MYNKHPPTPRKFEAGKAVCAVYMEYFLELYETTHALTKSLNTIRELLDKITVISGV